MVSLRPRMHSFADRALDELERTVASLTGGRPIIAGPWLSEVGFEILYWIPFLRWLRDARGLDPGRIVAVSRGGVGSWYSDVSASYVDIFDFMTVDGFRRHLHERWANLGGQKQGELGRGDRAILAPVLERVGATDPFVLHPSLMYRVFRAFWRGGAPLRHVLDHTVQARLPEPANEVASRGLPDGYWAVKLYFRPSFPDTDANRALARAVVAELAKAAPVVLLNTGLAVDDHLDFEPEIDEHVLRPLRGVDGVSNLGAQSALIGGAHAFVGTYGGLSYVAAAHGVPGVSLASHPEHYLPSHLDVARRAALATQAPFAVVHVTRLEAARLALSRSAGSIRSPVRS